MTKAPPTISYGHGFCDDCGEWYSLLYVKTEDGQSLAAIIVANDDIYDIEATASIGNHVGYYSYPDEGGANNLSLGSTTYTKIRYRFKCGNANVKAKIVLVFSDASTQTILAETNSQVFLTGVVTITAGKTIDHIRLYCNTATGHVYYDFAMIYKGDFTIPNTKYGQSFIAPGRLATNEAPGALGDEIQNLGNKSAIVDMSCDLDIGTWTRANDTMRGQVFLDIVHNSPTEPFQWLDLGDQVAQFKVLLDAPEWQNNASEGEAASVLHIVFHEYRKAPANSETVNERFGLDL